MSNYEESYYKTVNLIEEKIEESTDLEMKIHWIKTYKEVVLEEDIREELLDLTEDYTEAIYSNKVNVYNYQLPESFMILKQNELDWEVISTTQDLSREFIVENRDLIEFRNLNLSNYMKLNSDDIRSLYEDINWNYISMRDDLSIEFIREFKDHINWSYTSVNISFTEEEMEEFSEFLDWKMATMCQVYSDEFKEKHDLDQYVDKLKSDSEKAISSYRSEVSDMYGSDERSRSAHYENLKNIIIEGEKNNE